MRTKPAFQFQPFRITRLAGAITGMMLCTSAALATDYNDPYWASTAQNTDFIDNFTSTTLNRSYWDVTTKLFVNGEDQAYQDVEYPAADWTIRSGQPDADANDGKVLNLKARYMDGAIQDYYGGVAGQGKPQFIRSGRIESKLANNTTFTYGKFEARLKMPPPRNAEFPAFWLLGNYADVGWTACQELDIIEFTGHSPDKAPQTTWYAPDPSHHGVTSSYAALGLNPSAQFVTYGVIKTPDSAELYINGVKTATYSRDNLKSVPENQAWPYITPMHFILNHAITHSEWPDVGNYYAFSTDPNVANKTGNTKVVDGVTQYEYIDTASMAANIGRSGTDFLIDYVAHWPLPSTDPLQKYTDDSKYSFFRATNNTKGFYSLKGWLAPVAVTADAYLNEGNADDLRNNGPDNAADGYVGSKWATPRDDNPHSLNIDYGADKAIKYVWIEWSKNIPAAYDIYGKTSTGNWEFVLTSTQNTGGLARHVFDINKSYRYLKLVTRGRIDKSEGAWLLELMAFEDVANVYPKPATTKIDRTVNVITNGTFTTDLSGWKGENYDGTAPVYASVNQEAKITAVKEGANNGSYQFHTEKFGLKSNYRYQLSFKARADSPRNIIVRLGDDALSPPAAGIYLEKTVALTTTMTTQTFTVDVPNDSDGRLSFRFGKLGSIATVYLDDVVLSEVGYIGAGDPLVKAIDPNNFVSASSGWETDWWGVARRAVDGSTGNKASGNDGQSEGQDLWVSVKIDTDYDIKQVLVAGDKSSPRSLAQFKVEYGAGFSNTLLDWTASNKDGVYESFANFFTTPPVGERDFKISFRPPAGQLVEVADVQFLAVDNKPYRISTVALDNGGTIVPAGITRYSKSGSDSATYTFTPQSGYTVANVFVDGISVGAVNSYTFNAIAQNHTIAVAYNPIATPSSSSSSSSSVKSSSPSSVSSSSASSSSAAVGTYKVVSTTSVIFTVTSTVAPWVDLHYSVNNGGMRNVRMTHNADNTNTYTVTNIPVGALVGYNFTSQKTGMVDPTRVEFTMPTTVP